MSRFSWLLVVLHIQLITFTRIRSNRLFVNWGNDQQRREPSKLITLKGCFKSDTSSENSCASQRDCPWVWWGEGGQ